MIQQLSPHNWNSIRNRSQRVCKVSSNHLIKTYAMHNYILKKKCAIEIFDLHVQLKWHRWICVTRTVTEPPCTVWLKMRKIWNSHIKDVKRSVYVLVKTFCVPQLHVVQVRYYIIVINKIKVKTQARPRPVTYKATFNLCEM